MRQRGVTVRVILDVNREKTHNTSAYNYLSSNGVHVVLGADQVRGDASEDDHGRQGRVGDHELAI